MLLYDTFIYMVKKENRKMGTKFEEKRRGGEGDYGVSCSQRKWRLDRSWPTRLTSQPYHPIFLYFYPYFSIFAPIFPYLTLFYVGRYTIQGQELANLPYFSAISPNFPIFTPIFPYLPLFIGPRCPWGPIYGFASLSLSDWDTFLKLNWCDSGWWKYQLNTNW